MYPPGLEGRVAVVTGVSRRRGIGCAIARKLVAAGAHVFLTHFRDHDLDQPWGADDLDAVVSEIRASAAPGVRIHHTAADLSDPGVIEPLLDRATDAFGHVDILVCNHAHSGIDGALLELDTTTLDVHWQVDARSVLLLTAAFARRHDGRTGGRVVWLTSGQQLGPMRREVAYATAKAALAGALPTVADELLDRKILLNAVNPGPVNTGYLSPDTRDRDEETLRAVLEAFPQKRFGEPDDPARLIAWLVSDDGRWVVGQVIDSEGGFRRSRW